MKLRKLLFRDEQECSVDVVETWEVRWQSRHGEYSGDTRPEVRVFVTKIEADRFASSLKDAFDLIRHSSGNAITVRGASE